MHRTTTTAALLVTVAVSALSGCVTVPRPATPAPQRDTAPSLPTAPRPDGSTKPRSVQAPAQEALEMTGPSRHPSPRPPTTPDHPTGPPRVVHRPPAPPSHHAYPEPPRHSRSTVPDPSRAAPKTPDVCALGRQYGGWRTDSPEAEICERAYGH
ncbi:hypothetical protein ABT187_05750 [Streptomyces sp. NPDC001817]|uniref:hypothetical protein n=1 Tax=Streptomyces sp. NPDC001817 TaxID=3154398 RepID=UPI003331E8F1